MGGSFVSPLGTTRSHSMADRAVAVTGQETLRALLASKYFNTPKGQQCAVTNCQAGSGQSCNNFFCVECKVGGLCHGAFVAGGNHANHPSIQVWRVTNGEAVCVGDLRRITPLAHVNQIQLYKQNDRLLCKFKRSAGVNDGGGRGRVRECHGCGLAISAGKTANRSASPVCSVTCVLDYALAQRVDALIAAIDRFMPGEWDQLDAVAANGNQ